MSWKFESVPSTRGHEISGSASIETLARRIRYGGRKGRRAARRLHDLGHHETGAWVWETRPEVSG